MNLIEKLNKEIDQQTRNGRLDIYIETADLEKLGYHTNSKEYRQFIGLHELEMLMKKYQFKNSLRADTEIAVEISKENVTESYKLVNESKRIVSRERGVR